MAECNISCCNSIKLLSLLLGLLLIELIFFVGSLSLSIGLGAALRLLLRAVFKFELPIFAEVSYSWLMLGWGIHFYLVLYGKYLLPKVRNQIRTNKTLLRGIPRLIYFVVFSAAIYGACFEYEAVHNYRPLVVRQAVYNSVNTSHHRMHRLPVYSPQDFALEAPDEKLHTALFLTMVAYMIYSTGQILGIFLMKLSNGLPVIPILPQAYATFLMMIAQVLMTLFYSFPLLMTLVACHVFRVDGASTYMFTLCLAVTIGMAAAQLESEPPFPNQAHSGPFYFFECQHRARVNLLCFFLPAIAYYYFKPEKSYPLNGRDLNFIRFTFWLMVTLLHAVKSMYLTTWKPFRPLLAIEPEERELGQDFDIFIAPMPLNNARREQGDRELIIGPRMVRSNTAGQNAEIVLNGNEEFENEHVPDKITEEKVETDLNLGAQKKKFHQNENSGESSRPPDPDIIPDREDNLDRNDNSMVNVEINDCFKDIETPSAHDSTSEAGKGVEEAPPKIEKMETTV